MIKPDSIRVRIPKKIDGTSLVQILEHAGVPGMKWGVRKSRSSGGTTESKGVTRFKDKPKNLTDAELQTRIKRIETEKKYRELNKRTVSTGQKLATEVLTSIGKQTATSIGVSAATFGAKKAIEKRFGKDVHNGMFPKKGK